MDKNKQGRERAINVRAVAKPRSQNSFNFREHLSNTSGMGRNGKGWKSKKQNKDNLYELTSIGSLLGKETCTTREAITPC